MPTLRALILDNREDVLQEILIANGYDTAVQRVFRVPIGLDAIPEYPAINMIDRGDATKRLVGLANENTMTLEIEMYFREQDATEKLSDLQDFIGDVKRAMQEDETCDELAIRVRATTSAGAPFEIQSPHAVARAAFEILYRESRLDPDIQQII